MPGLTDTKYVVCECGSKRFSAKDTFMIQKRDVGVRNDEGFVSRVTSEKNEYFCAQCGAPVDLNKFINTR